MTLGTEVGLGPCHIVLWGPISSTDARRTATRSQPLQSSAM